MGGEGTLFQKHTDERLDVAKAVLSDALRTFGADAQNTALIGTAQDRFNSVVNTIRKIGLSEDDVASITSHFINESLDFTNTFTPDEREAAVHIGLTFGDHRFDDVKRHTLHRTYNDAKVYIDGAKSPNKYQLARAASAESLLLELGREVKRIETPSVLSDNKKQIAMGGTAMALAFSILTPSMTANASEVTVLESKPTKASSVSSTAVGVSFSEATTTHASETTSLTATPEASVKSVSVGVNMNKIVTASKHAADPIVGLSGVAENTEKSIAVKVSMPRHSTETPSNTPSLSSKSNEAPLTQKVSVAMPSETTPTTKTSDTTEKSTVAPVILTNQNQIPSTSETTENPDKIAQLTQGQKNIQLAQNSFNTQTIDISVPTASQLIQNGYGVGSSSSAQNNDHFENSLLPLLVGLETVMQPKGADQTPGHTDTTYVNEALMTLSVLDAAANDQSILNSKSPDIVALLKNAQPPTDKYQALVFKQYLDDSNKTLDANNGEALKGFTNTDEIRNLYAYTLMATASDSDIQTRIQAIKDDEVKAAELKKQQEEQQQQNEQNKQNNGDTGSEAIQNLIDHAPTQVEKNMFIAMQAFVNDGYTPTQAAGMVGNLHKESASSMDPGLHQFNGGPGRGLAQWEIGGRWDKLDEFAKAQGKSWDDLTVQINFIVYEMKNTRTQALAPVKDATTLYDATYAFMRYYETPAVVIHGINTGDWSRADAEAKDRASRGQPILDAYNNEVNAINKAHDAEAQKQKDAAHKKAEQEAQSINGMNMDQASKFVSDYLTDPTSINYIGGAGQSCSGGPLSNCVSFSTFYINKYTNLGGMGKGTLPGNGGDVAGNIVARNPQVQMSTTPEVDAVFSTEHGAQSCPDGSLCGHTGIVLGIDKANNKIIIGEAACNAAPASWDGAHEYALDTWSNGDHKYALVGKYLKAPLQ